MFRPMRRLQQQVSAADCNKILTEEKRAALSVIGDDGYPYTVPVNFFYDETNRVIYLHGAGEGHKADAIRRCDKVCLTVWNQGFKKPGSWEWNATSVVVFGRAQIVTDSAVAKKYLRQLAIKYYPTAEAVQQEMNSPAADCVQVLAIRIEHMTGKLVNEK